MKPFSIDAFEPVFFDTEFTHLGKDADLISIGMVDISGTREFYRELRYDTRKESAWVRDNVVPLLKGGHLTKDRAANFVHGYLWGLHESSRKTVLMVSDCLAYDWILFCDLFGGAEKLPKFIYYIPLDLSTLFAANRIDMDVSREKFSGIDPAYAKLKHNAAYDARVIRRCFLELMRKPMGIVDQS